MPALSLREVLDCTRGELLRTGEKSFSDVVTDTRKITAGALFVALKGERFDGHAFVHQAAAQGAAGAIVSGAVMLDEPIQLAVIRVEDTLTAYQDLARLHRRRFAAPVIAITGSNGKTTTKDLTAAMLSGKMEVLKTQANFNNEIGLPLTLLQLSELHEVAVVEMGMRGFGQIARLAEIAEPTVGIVTNVGETHMELLGSLENIARAKGELVEAIPASGTVLLNADDPRVLAMKNLAKGRVMTFGCSEEADIRAVDVIAENESISFTCRWREQSSQFIILLAGRHNVSNALAAIAAGLCLGLTFEEMKKGLEQFVPSDMRLAVSRHGSYTFINDAYNASPMSMAAAIETLRDISKGRAIAVLGDMLELGAIAIEAHETIGRLVAERKIDVLITLGEMSEYLAKAAQYANVAEVIACSSHADAIDALKRRLKSGDTVLFKGSRGMRMEKIIAGIE